MSVINDALKKADGDENSNSIPPLANPGFKHQSPKKGSSWMRILLLLVLVLGGLLYLGYTQILPMIQKKVEVGLKEKAKDIYNQNSSQFVQDNQGVKLTNLLMEGKAAFEINQLEHALKLFQDAYRLSPNNAEVLNDIGMVYRKQGNMSEALKYYKLALEKDPRCATCQNNIGVIFSKQNNPKDAQKAFMDSINIDPNYSDPHLNLALLLEKQDKKDDAIKHFQNFIDKATKKQSALTHTVQNHIEQLSE